MINRTARYDVSLWWGEPEGWHRHRARIGWRALGRVLWRLRRSGWSEVSVLVGRVDEGWDGLTNRERREAAGG